MSTGDVLALLFGLMIFLVVWFLFVWPFLCGLIGHNWVCYPGQYGSTYVCRRCGHSQYETPRDW